MGLGMMMLLLISCVTVVVRMCTATSTVMINMCNTRGTCIW
jgi:hypothetical protein